jgi:hypothetical protein
MLYSKIIAVWSKIDKHTMGRTQDFFLFLNLMVLIVTTGLYRVDLLSLLQNTEPQPHRIPVTPYLIQRLHVLHFEHPEGTLKIHEHVEEMVWFNKR